MKYFFISYILVAISIVSFAGLRGHKFEKAPFELFNDMDRQAKLKHQQNHPAFEDGHGMRHPVEGTQPIGYSVPAKPAAEGHTPQDLEFTQGSGYYFTGVINDHYGNGLPEEIEVTPQFLERGRDRYNIHCAVCHGESGNGKGIVSTYTTVVPTDLTTLGSKESDGPTFRPDGKIYDAIVNGSNQMGAYGANISIQDRWAIVAYVRALEFAAKNPSVN